MEQKELDGKVWEVSGFVFENEDQAKLAKKGSGRNPVHT